MLEFGQPTHAFDADKLDGDINVRVARDGEEFLALDGRTYRLSPNDLVIADQKRTVGIGGVMGGEETGVSDSTSNILLEAAYFTPSGIRRTARTLALPSDASYRFERGVDPEMILKASERATQLIAEIAGGKPAAEISIAGSLPKPPDDVSLRYEKCDRLIGVHLDPDEINTILERFGLEKGKTSKTEATWTTQAIGGICCVMSISSKRSCALMVCRELPAPIAADSPERVMPIVRMILNRNFANASPAAA